MVGSAVIKQGRSANRKHTYFFFGLIIDTVYRSAGRFIFSTFPVLLYGMKKKL